MNELSWRKEENRLKKLAEREKKKKTRKREEEEEEEKNKVGGCHRAPASDEVTLHEDLLEMCAVEKNCLWNIEGGGFKNGDLM